MFYRGANETGGRCRTLEGPAEAFGRAKWCFGQSKEKNFAGQRKSIFVNCIGFSKMTF
jgi:hypothetical protein